MYLLSVLVVELFVPAFHTALYEPTKDHIRWLIPLKTPWLDNLMYFMSFIGDGEPYFYAIMVNWAYCKWSRTSTNMFEANYFLLVFLSSNCVCQLLKSLYSHSRPYFDDITLGDTVFKDCATEYGNPSGHS